MIRRWDPNPLWLDEQIGVDADVFSVVRSRQALWIYPDIRAVRLDLHDDVDLSFVLADTIPDLESFWAQDLLRLSSWLRPAPVLERSATLIGQGVPPSARSRHERPEVVIEKSPDARGAYRRPDASDRILDVLHVRGLDSGQGKKKRVNAARLALAHGGCVATPVFREDQASELLLHALDELNGPARLEGEARV